MPEPMAPQALKELERAPLLGGAQLVGPQGKRHPAGCPGFPMPPVHLSIGGWTLGQSPGR